MDPCKIYDCDQQSASEIPATDSGEKTGDKSDDHPFLFTTKILIPIVLVLGIFILVSIGLIARRIIVTIVRKRRRFMVNGRDRSPNGIENGSNSRSNVSSVSRNSGLPSYGQVMAAIEREDAPPSYFKVAMGTVNFSFNGDDDLPNDARASIEQTARPGISHSVARPNASQQHEPSQCPLPSAGEDSFGTDAHRTIESDGRARGETQTCNHFSSVQRNEVRDRNAANNSTANQSEIPLSPEAHISVFIRNIDEIIDSISVPSTLPPGSIRKKRIQRNNVSQNNNVEECTSFSSVPCRACIPKTQPITAGQNRVTLESTPV